MTSHSTMGGDLTLPDFLDWVADRLVNVYHEDPTVDFVHSARNFAKRIRAAMAPTEDPDSPTPDYQADAPLRGSRAYLADALYAFSVPADVVKPWHELTDGQRGAWITKAQAVPSVAGVPCRPGAPVYEDPPQALRVEPGAPPPAFTLAEAFALDARAKALFDDEEKNASLHWDRIGAGKRQHYRKLALHLAIEAQREFR